MAEQSVVIVYDPVIARLFSRSKDVGKFGDRFADKAVRKAKEFTPHTLPPDPRPWKSEHLRERNRHRGYLRAGAYLGQVVMENTASYARYAWRRGPVFANGILPWQGLQVPRIHVGGGSGFIYPRSVGPHYDPREHWLERGVRAAARGKI